ncbi:MAG: hypothetical protein BLM47_04135 [Candidatus Reconcilbacillus cellulovorans]|mgnify:CR=1 FL=1|uniref:Tripartite ATP-independent periplasmic transporters DctQ component domain-containing protein n=1 Tax=Candidatus Reconcilbacillus cellulovorans TaxID=1906605 RepID=A0A2A6E2N1_9BACL|nr:MAG: hypothetical protein BLM47_04135 [Candidatus Reconcilbacillus cellulovorans]
MLRKKVSAALDNLGEALGAIGGIATFVMVIFVTFNVLTRKLLKWSMPGFYEVLGLIGALFYGAGIVYAAIRGDHIVTRVLLDRLSAGRMKTALVLFSRIAVLVMCGWLVDAGWRVTAGMLDERTLDLRIPVAPFRYFVVASFVLLALLILGGKEIGSDDKKVGKEL